MFRSILVSLFGLMLAQAASAGGYLDLSRDYKLNARDVTTLVAGAEVKRVQLFGVYDSSNYGEALAGSTIKLGEYVSMTPYAGVEWLTGKQPKLRGMLVTNAQYGSFSGLSVVEFAGNTGNFNLQQFSYNVGKLTFSLTRHSVAGGGIRLDWKASPALSLYFRKLERFTTVGANYSF